MCVCVFDFVCLCVCPCIYTYHNKKIILIRICIRMYIIYNILYNILCMYVCIWSMYKHSLYPPVQTLGIKIRLTLESLRRRLNSLRKENKNTKPEQINKAIMLQYLMSNLFSYTVIASLPATHIHTCTHVHIRTQ